VRFLSFLSLTICETVVCYISKVGSGMPHLIIKIVRCTRCNSNVSCLNNTIVLWCFTILWYVKRWFLTYRNLVIYTRTRNESRSGHLEMWSTRCICWCGTNVCARVEDFETNTSQWSEDCFYYCSERNNVVVLFGTLKVQSFVLIEVSHCGLLIVVTSSTFLKRKDMLKEKYICTWIHTYIYIYIFIYTCVYIAHMHIL